MKCVYIIWPDVDYIEKLISSGIDTLIIANLDEPNDLNSLNFWGSWKDTKKLLDLYNNDPRVNIIFSPIWVRYWEDLPPDQRFVYKNGVSKNRTPCPNNEQFVQDRVAYAKSIATKYNTMISFDMEHYLNDDDVDKSVGILEIYDVTKRNRLKCRKQNAGSVKKQYNKHKNNIKTRVNDLSSVGFYPYGNYWVCKLFGKRGVFFDESTYKGIKFKHRWFAFWRKVFTGTPTIAGIWCDVHKPDEIIKQIKKSKKWGFKGYWLYSQARFSRFTPMRKGKIPFPNNNPYYQNLVDVDDPAFFNKLKMTNKI